MKFLFRHASVLLLAVAFYFIQGPELIHHPTDRVGDPGDFILNTWILAWDAHALTTPHVSIWGAPLMYPVRRGLTFSETMFGNLWITLPVQALTGNPILAAHALIFSAFVLGMYATFLLVHDLTRSYLAGVVAGLLFSFNPIRWCQLAHMNLLPFFWAPLALMWCHRFLESRKPAPFFAMLAAVIAQYYTSMNLGTLLVTMLGVFVSVHCLCERRGAERYFLILDVRVRRMLLLGIALSALFLAPLFRPYLHTVRDWDFSRTQADNIAFSTEPLGFLVPTDTFASYFWLPHYLPSAIRGSYWLGVMPWLFAAAGLWVARINRQQPYADARLARRLAWTALVCVIFMLGPKLLWLDHPLPVPLPYMLVYHTFPPARGMRVPARFFLPLLLCLSTLAGFAVARAAQRWRHWNLPTRALCVAAVLFWLGLDYRVGAIPGIPEPDRAHFPSVYPYLAQGDQRRPILELPAALGGQFDYLYYQTAHWRPLVGGETGNFPPGHLQLAQRTAGPPTSTVLHFLQLVPADTLIIHLDRYPQTLANAWSSAPLDQYGFHKAGRFGNALVWERTDASPTCSPTLRITSANWTVQKHLWRNRLSLSLEFSPAQASLPWRYLHRQWSDMTVTLTGHDGRSRTLATSVRMPPYLLAGEKVTVQLEPIGPIDGNPDTIELRAPWLEAFQVPTATQSASVGK